MTCRAGHHKLQDKDGAEGQGLSQCPRKADTQVTEDRDTDLLQDSVASPHLPRLLPAEGDPTPGHPQDFGAAVTPTYRARKPRGSLSLKASVAGAKFEAQTSPTPA